MRGNTPVAPQGIKIPPLPDAPVRYETAEGQTIRVASTRAASRIPGAWRSCRTTRSSWPNAAAPSRSCATASSIRSRCPARRWPSGRGCRARTWRCTRTSSATASSISATPSRSTAATRRRRLAVAPRAVVGRAKGSPARGTSSSAKAAAAARSRSAATACCTSRHGGGDHADAQDPRRQDPAAHRRGQGAARQSVRRPRRREARSLHDGPPQHSCGWRSTRSPARSGRSRTGRTAATR